MFPAVLISLAYFFSTSCADFYWSSAGPVAGKVCTQWIEGAEPESTTWDDNYFCSDIDYGMKWSSAGTIANMRCTQIIESAEPESHTWDDNYFCVPLDSPLYFSWSSSGPIGGGLQCLQIIESAEPEETTWGDNYLCWDPCDVKVCDNGNDCDGVETCAAGTLGTCVSGEPLDCGFAFVCDPDVLGGKCVRDCDSFAIDDYLECSYTFGNLETEVTNLITRANNVDSRIDGIDSRIAGVDSRIDGVDSDITDLHDKIARFGALFGVNDPNYAAETGPNNFLDGVVVPGTTVKDAFNVKDIFIISLLVINLLVMSSFYCCKGKKSNTYSKVHAFSDSEAQQFKN